MDFPAVGVMFHVTLSLFAKKNGDFLLLLWSLHLKTLFGGPFGGLDYLYPSVLSKNGTLPQPREKREQCQVGGPRRGIGIRQEELTGELSARAVTLDLLSP